MPSHLHTNCLFERGEIMRIIKLLLSIAAVVLVARLASAEVVSRTFTPEEITKMSQTRAVIQTQFGIIELRFLPELAPNHVNSFIELAKKGFYDGTIFHRVIPGFMIQGGDPNTKGDNKATYGTGGPDYTLKAEFNARTHARGVLSMARSSSPDSAGSQFFICVANSSFLDGQYTVFGEVVSGTDVADKIVNQPRNLVGSSTNPKDNPNERIEIKIKIIEK